MAKSRRRTHKRTKRNRRSKQKGGSVTPTFHIIIATGGRPTLKRMIDSLKGELESGDAVTIIFDGPEARGKSGYEDSWIGGFKASIFTIDEVPNGGYWGHVVRNKYQGQLQKSTTFVMNGDDDDVYIEGSFKNLRKICVDPPTLYIGKMTYENNPGLIIPRQNETITESDIGTPNGIIPFDKAGLGQWGLKYNGDFEYYNTLKPNVKKIRFIDEVFYRVSK